MEEEELMELNQLEEFEEPQDYGDSTEDEDEDEYEEGGGRVALAFDPNQLSQQDGPPQNGHDYLKMVQAERTKYPSVLHCLTPPKQSTIAGVNQEQSENSSSTPKKMQSNSKRSDNTLVIENCDEILKNFNDLRQKIEDIRKTKSPVQLRDQIEISKAGSASSSHDSNHEVDEAKQLKLSERRANHLLKLIELGYSPEVSTLLHQDQMALHLTLTRLADQCEIMPNLAVIPTEWIYSIMAALREPLEGDIYSTFRRIARLCIARRDRYLGKRIKGDDGIKLKENHVKNISHKEYVSSLLIICIVHHFFGQTDLK